MPDHPSDEAIRLLDWLIENEGRVFLDGLAIPGHDVEHYERPELRYTPYGHAGNLAYVRALLIVAKRTLPVVDQ